MENTMHIKAAFLKTLVNHISDILFLKHIYTAYYVDLFSQKYITCNHLKITRLKYLFAISANPQKPNYNLCTFVDLRVTL